MNFIADLPKSPGTYRHRWIDHAALDRARERISHAALRREVK